MGHTRWYLLTYTAKHWAWINPLRHCEVWRPYLNQWESLRFSEFSLTLRDSHWFKFSVLRYSTLVQPFIVWLATIDCIGCFRCLFHQVWRRYVDIIWYFFKITLCSFNYKGLGKSFLMMWLNIGPSKNHLKTYNSRFIFILKTKTP